MGRHHHHRHRHAAELVPWGTSEVYSIKNIGTGNYLAAHEDGHLVCEDSDVKHHDIPFGIAFHPPSEQVSLICFINLLWVGVDAQNIPKAVKDADLNECWHIEKVDQYYALKSANGKYLSAIPPVAGKDAVLATSDTVTDAEKWAIEPTTEPPPREPKA